MHADHHGTVPTVRIRRWHDEEAHRSGAYVLYWMIAFRRGRYNFALQRAVELARKFQRPLLILEALRSDYRWASDRLHTFVLQGMCDNRQYFGDHAVTYYPYVETHPGAGRGLLRQLMRSACAVVTDDFPCFFLPRMVSAAARKCPVQFESVDANGILPVRATTQVFSRAFSFRGFLQQELPHHLPVSPIPDPLADVKLPRGEIPRDIQQTWPAWSIDQRSDIPAVVASLPVDHDVTAAPAIGGPHAAERRLQQFLAERLARYAEARNQPQEAVTSELSPYLHFGHISPHHVFAQLSASERWSVSQIQATRKGSREGWWGMSPAAEAFLDEFITWRELGYNMSCHHPQYDQYESLPDWARATLQEHADDPRDAVYSLAEFEQAATHDALWNAAQTQLRREGTIHNYLRMLWGKKILEWSTSPPAALQTMIELNNKYALDGRNPNSYSGIMWVLGRYDRAWGPERPVYGKIRYMSSDNTARKVRVQDYIARYGQ